MDLGLAGKKVLITGSSRGLGFSVARHFCIENAVVCINGRDGTSLSHSLTELQAGSSASVFAITGDVTAPGMAERIVEKAASEMGGLDILVTNTGGPKSGPFENLTDEDWQSAANLVIFSHIRLIRAALPLLRKSDSASILTVTSYSVKQPIPNLILSNSLRAATASLTKSLALELGPEGIRVNSILPGWTETERVVELMQARALKNNTSIEFEIKQQAKESPMNRIASPDEFARVAVFLASPAASYLTGTLLSVDGGMVKSLF